MKIEKWWREDIQPVVTPTVAELETAKRRVRYKEGLPHFSVAGIAISGRSKSPLINAFHREAGATAVCLVLRLVHFKCKIPGP